jgi:hypothetical protein
MKLILKHQILYTVKIDDDDDDDDDSEHLCVGFHSAIQIAQ